MTDYIGFKWLAKQLDIREVQPLAVESQVGKLRRTVISSIRKETYSRTVRPDPTTASHLSFALKHELVNLEFLARLFSVIDQAVLEDWIRSEPTGAYARRAGFLFEWLTGRRLDVQDTSSGNYVDALNPIEFVVASRASNTQRWRVRDNLPGTRDFCPTIRRTDAVRALEHFNCAAALESLEIQFGADILARSAVWLSIKEGRASFAIENEEKQVDRVKRFAAVMEHRCGQNGDPLALQALSEIQGEILGIATRYGVRQSPAVIGYTHSVENIVEYIAPPWERTMELLVGLQRCLAKTTGTSSLLRASIASFGFVYIHPMSDGNGRIARFLVNDVLRRDGAIPAPFILPISATITNRAQQRLGYSRALENLSRPLVSMYQEDFHFGNEYTCPDGVRSNFHFDAYDDALPTWRYPDLTHQSEFLGNIIRCTIEVEMSNEASSQRDIERARHAIKGSLEGPNSDLDQIIRSVRDNGWTVSNDLIKKFPHLAATSLAAAVVAAVRNVFQPEAVDATFVINMKRS